MANRVHPLWKAATRLERFTGTGRSGSIVEVARIEGKIFKTMKEAEGHGLELAKEWVDKRWAGL